MKRDAIAAVEAGGEAGERAVRVETGESRTIALNRLHLSERNTRKVRDPDSICSLAAMIAAQGLLYPLCVVAERCKGAKKEAFGVVAGGRRLAALQLLAKQGRLAKDAPIACLLLGGERAVAVSLTENAAQEAMHPADQLAAFKALVDRGQSAGQIAAAFGVSVQTVERRLKLAGLAPMFMALYRNGEIGQQQLEALTLADGHQLQIQAWKSLPEHDRGAHAIRRLLTKDEVAAEHPVAAFVGGEAYRAAGGAVRKDLFSPVGEAWLEDAGLLSRLALARLEIEAQPLRAAGWKWVEPRVCFSYQDRAEFAQLRCEPAEPNAQQKEAMGAIESGMERIQARMDEIVGAASGDDSDEDGWTPGRRAEHEALDKQWAQRECQLGALRDALRVWSPEQKAAAGVVVTVGRDGSPQVVEGLVRAEDRQALATVQGTGGVTGAGGPAAPKQRPEFGASLCQSLTAHRSVAVAAALTQNPKVALAALLHAMIVSDGAPWCGSPLQMRFDGQLAALARAAVEYEQSPAARVLQQAGALAQQLPGDPAQLFERLRAMALPELAELLALYVARCYTVGAPEPVRAPGRGFDPAVGIEAALGIDMADWWQPTPERYLNHVSRTKIVEAVTEACGAQAGRPLEKMKKAEAVAAAARWLDGKRWLPSTLRAYHAPAVADRADGDGDDGRQSEG